MLNPLPDLLTLGFFAPLLIRVAVGSFFLAEARHYLMHGKVKATNGFAKHFGKAAPFFVRTFGTIESVLGVLFIAGFLTQVVALVGAVIGIKMLLFGQKLAGSPRHSRITYVLIIAGCLSLVLSGAGALAIDLPL